MESLDWGALDPRVPSDKKPEMTEDPVLNPANDDSRMDDNFDWPDKWTEAETWQNPTRLVQGTERQVKNTTAYAVRKLQKVYRQSVDGIFGSLALAALEQAKSYEVCTREQLPVDEFSHIAVTCGAVKYNAGEEVLEIKIYINGQLANRRSINRQSIGNIHQAILGAKANELRLNEQVSSYSAYFKGAISEVRLWKTDLSHADILAKMHRRLNTSETHNPDLVGYWRLEEGNSFQRGNSVVCKCYDNLASLLPAIYAPQIRMEVRESSASLSLFTANNFPAIPLPSGLKSSQKIDLQQPIAQSANLPATKKGLTIEFWVRWQSGNGSIVSGGALGRDQYSIIWRNNKVRLQLYRQGKLTTEVETQQTISSLQWHHVALTLTWDDDAWEVRLYLDGKPQNTVAIQAQVKSLNSRENGKSVIVFIANGFAEGQQTLSLFSTNEKNNEQFHGSIAELRVWPVARSQNQIKVYLGQRLRGCLESS